ncbi:MAG: crossover junction endodeoxyribonuclease RuvC, partial [Candidatus Dadabacteria bacterium]
SGVIRAGRGDTGVRLGRIFNELAAVIARYRPGELSLERNFLARNVQSAFRLGEARGVAMAAAARAEMSTHEYTPATIKKALVGHGRAGKEQVQAAVVRLFGLREMPAEDEADALAAAACHGFRRRYEQRLRSALAAGAR